MKTALGLRRVAVLLTLSLLVTSALRSPAQTNVVSANAPDLPAVAQWPSPDKFPGQGPIRTEKETWFVSNWSKLRAQWWKSRQQDKGAVIFVGDSITQGWRNLAADFPKYKVANRGISGDVTRGVWQRLPEDVLDEEPVAIVLLIGTNDIDTRGTPEDAASNILGIMKDIKARLPGTPIIFCRVMPSSPTKNRPTEKLQKINELLEAGVQGDQRVKICDTWSIFANEKNEADPAIFPDLLHPNAAGYAKWKAALDPILATLNLPEKPQN